MDRHVGGDEALVRVAGVCVVERDLRGRQRVVAGALGEDEGFPLGFQEQRRRLAGNDVATAEEDLAQEPAAILLAREEESVVDQRLQLVLRDFKLCRALLDRRLHDCLRVGQRLDLIEESLRLARLAREIEVLDPLRFSGEPGQRARVTARAEPGERQREEQYGQRGEHDIVACLVEAAREVADRGEYGDAERVAGNRLGTVLTDDVFVAVAQRQDARFAERLGVLQRGEIGVVDLVRRGQRREILAAEALAAALEGQDAAAGVLQRDGAIRRELDLEQELAQRLKQDVGAEDAGLVRKRYGNGQAEFAGRREHVGGGDGEAADLHRALVPRADRWLEFGFLFAAADRLAVTVEEFPALAAVSVERVDDAADREVTAFGRLQRGHDAKVLANGNDLQELVVGEAEVV